MRPRRLVLGFVVVACALVAGAATTGASPTATAPGVVVSPATSLTPGQSVSVVGTHLAPHRTYTVEECSQRSFVVMLHVCNRGRAIQVTTGRTGSFRSELTIEVCPPLRRQAAAPATVCYVGAVTLAGVDVDSLAGAAKITVKTTA